MMTADTTLAPCPFCGHVPLRNLGDSDNLVMLVCPPESACAASGLCTGYLLDDEAQAIAAWNRRAPTPASGTQAVGLAEFALRALVAADHVTQAKVDAAKRLPGAPAPREPAIPYTRSGNGKWATFNIRAEHADAAENALKGVSPQGPALVPLKAEKIAEIWVEHGLDDCDPEGFARRIEAAHGIRP